MSRTSRRAAFAVVALAGGPLLAACATAPGAAAVVGGHQISVDHLQTVVQTALKNPQAASQFGSDRASFTRQILARMISEQVIAAEAAAHHVTVTSTDIATQQASFVQQTGSLTALRQDAAQQGLPADQLAALIRADALQSKVGEALVANAPVSHDALEKQYRKNISSYQTVHVAHILVKTQALAQQLLSKVEHKPSEFASLAEQYSIDTGSKSKGGDLGYVGRGQTVSPFDKAIFSHPDGSYFIVHSQFGYHVVHVIAHRTKSLASVTPQLKSAVLSSQRQSLLASAFLDESKRLHVHVSPRYGKWDPVHQAVTALANPVSSGG